MGRAVSLVELLLAVSLISLVLFSAAALYTAAAGFFSTFNTQAEMQNQANIALQHMVRHICAADNVNILEPSRVRVSEIEPDGTTHEYEYWLDNSCSCIKYNGGGDEEIIATKVEELIFSDYYLDPDSQRITLNISLTMQGYERLILQPLEYSTKVTLRRYE
jgi:hypothetical protein